ncbi:NAD(P)H-dependent oxidoreductase [Halomonas sp. HP20-15]|uniref:NADPH-dependent FMN reductase n=1 Tax=Halomonas sp. HP20-15 TaxID=3085901 RepID=UPI0029826F12|nr:NAD(P)H-dependent oxidoreductase [Halomonas sp. HP20-15]MDW5375807.1 NAD(P)H-dependent oxidoreductase [Halomonas sp. HP20-15]
MTAPLALTMILGGAPPTQFRDRVVRWVARQLRDRDQLAVTLLDCVHDSPQLPTEAIAARLDVADGFLVLTPEYTRGDPMTLERLLDAIDAPWAGKPVALIGYGGDSGGERAVARLQERFVARRALALPEPLCCADAYGRFGLHGALYASLGEPLRLARLIARLELCARALRAARSARPASVDTLRR